MKVWRAVGARGSPGGVESVTGGVGVSGEKWDVITDVEAAFVDRW